MKQLKTIRIAFIFLSINIFVFTSCHTNKKNALAPTVSYNTTNLHATIFEAGHTTVLPTVNWNGDEGIFSLSPSIEGLSINTINGELNWTKYLPVGKHNIVVTATNSNGSTNTNITINNPLQNIFSGDLYIDNITFPLN